MLSHLKKGHFDTKCGQIKCRKKNNYMRHTFVCTVINSSWQGALRRLHERRGPSCKSFSFRGDFVITQPGISHSLYWTPPSPSPASLMTTWPCVYFVFSTLRSFEDCLPGIFEMFVNKVSYYRVKLPIQTHQMHLPPSKQLSVSGRYRKWNHVLKDVKSYLLLKDHIS